MTTPKQGEKLLREFKDFVTFLQNLWSVLAGVSVLFPVSNVLVRLIPLETFEQEGALVWFSPALFTALSTLVSLFVVLWTFGQRRQYRSPRRRRGIRLQAAISFLLGIVALISYLVVYFFLLRDAYEALGWESDDINWLKGEVPLLILYGAFFALTTRAFMLLGMDEYYSGR